MMVISIVAIIGILAFTLLTVTLITFQMKNTNMNSKKNFYSAEQVLDDISVGLQHDVSTAVGKAYAYTLENFSNVNEATRKTNYINKFQEELLNLIQQSGDTSLNRHYSVDHLKTMISSEVSSAAKTLTVEAAGGANALNQDTEAGTFTIKNLSVTYLDDRGYMTQINTDIVLSCPQIEFDQMSTSPLDLTTFAMVANEKTKSTGLGVEVEGNAYLGNAGLEVDSAGSLTFNPQGTSGSRLITADNMSAKQGSTLTVNDGIQTWARGVVVDSSTVELQGTTYLNNDIVLQNSAGGTANLTMKGLLYAYGNPSTAQNVAEVYKDDTKTFQLADHNATNTGYGDVHQADFSSSILINGNNAKVDLSGLSEMILAGNSYIGASLKDSNNSDILIGESLSLKSDQRAYLVPNGYIASYCEQYGGRNPMTGEEFTKLQEEMMQKLGYSSANQIKDVDYVKPSADAADSIPQSLLRLGVTGIRKGVYQVSVGTGAQPKQMVYFFLEFDSEKSAADYANTYYGKQENLNSLIGRLYPLSDVGNYDIQRYEILYPEDKDVPNNFGFYYNGSVLVPKGEETKFYPGKLEQADSLNLTQKAISYQNTFASLRHKLTVDSTGISASDRAKTIYQYLVVPDMAHMSDSAKNISSGNKKIFKQDEVTGVLDKMCAVVVNNHGGSAYHLTGTEDVGYPVRVVIASGDVVVTTGTDFKGLIVAGGTVTLEQGAKLTADTALAQQALRIADGTISAADYLIDGHIYTIGGTESEEDDNNEIRLSDYVTFDNWSKQ
ncbi:MAG: 3,4-dihydroxy-2-butanone-4-phosphate synthase [Lachnospiraceae bacterium]|nr:3,4-dihydroxy-2-butanone-4-phosphate synthase [Lachnospiraceae bacterium]